MGYSSMTKDLDCTLLQATLGLTVYALGFAFVPLFTSSFSEEFGRFPFYVVSSFMFGLTEVMTALAPNVQTVIIARAVGGCFGSTGATLVAGTIADIWQSHQRGFPMSLYALGVIASAGLGPMVAGWIEASPSLQWRWIQWIHAIVTAVWCISMLLILRETRSAVILARMARQVRKDTGDDRYRARSEVNKPRLVSMIATSCTRPLRLLLTEPVVQSFSLWIGFVWGVLFFLLDSLSSEFENIYGFTVGESGSVCAAIVIGSFLGYLVNIYQERLYKKIRPPQRPRSSSLHSLRSIHNPSHRNTDLCVDCPTRYPVDSPLDRSYAFHDLHFCHISSRIRLLGRLLRAVCIFGAGRSEHVSKLSRCCLSALHEPNERPPNIQMVRYCLCTNSGRHDPHTIHSFLLWVENTGVQPCFPEDPGDGG